jgi:hypothetical protein
MKNMILILAAMFGVSAYAVAAPKKVTIKTNLTCQQDDGDDWVEFGLVIKPDNTGRVYVVKHKEPDTNGTLIANYAVEKTVKGKTVTWVDETSTLKAVVVEGNKEEVGSLKLSDEISEEEMPCYEDSDISFDRQLKKAKR